MSDETLSEDLRLWAGEKYIQEKINEIVYLSSPSIFCNPTLLPALSFTQRLNSSGKLRRGRRPGLYAEAEDYFATADAAAKLRRSILPRAI